MINKKRLCYFAYRMSYPIVDIIVIAFSIIFSYKFYYYIGIGKRVFYNKSFYVPLSISAALFIVIVMAIIGVYKKDKTGLQEFTGRGWQNNQPLSFYEDEIRQNFSNLIIHKKEQFLIISFK